MAPTRFSWSLTVEEGFSLKYTRAYPELQSKVAGYVTLSTPHHGADEPDNLLSDDWPGFPFLQDYRNQCRKVSDREACNRAAQSMRIEEMMKFNYGAGCHIQEMQDDGDTFSRLRVIVSQHGQPQSREMHIQ